MKRLQCLLITPFLLVLLSSATLAGDMHSDAKSPSPPPLTRQADDLVLPQPVESEVQYLDVIFDALDTLLRAVSIY